MKLGNVRSQIARVCAVALVTLPMMACDSFNLGDDGLEIPTVDEAEAEAAESIDEANLDEVLAELEAEIEADASDD